MNSFATAVLLGSILVVPLLFMWLPGRRAATVSVVGGYLFLPPGGIEGFGFVPIGKETCLSVGLLLGMLVSGGAAVRAIRFRKWDLFMVVWCLVPIASSITNELGFYDGLSAAANATLVYAVPYVLGRAYLRDARDLEAFGQALALGGIIYAPLCWYEMRMSPTLNLSIYGFSLQGITESKRLGGWRPAVFMQHGLAVGMWMGSTAIVSLALWRAQRLPRFAGVPAGLWVALLVVTAVGCASSGAIALMIIGALVLLASYWLRSLFPLLILALISPTYLAARVVFDWRPDALVEAVSEFDADRAGSLRLRVESDTAFRAHAMMRPWFGWGGWGRGTSIAYAADSFFGIAISKHGIVGLIGAFGALIAAQLCSVHRMRRLRYGASAAMAVTPLVLALAMYTLDCLLNGMLSPVFMTAAGGLMAWSTSQAGDGRTTRTVGGHRAPQAMRRRGGGSSPPQVRDARQ